MADFRQKVRRSSPPDALGCPNSTQGDQGYLVKPRKKLIMLTPWPYNPIIKEWRKPHKPCDLNTPDCGAECVLFRNTTRRIKFIKRQILKKKLEKNEK